MRAVGETFQKRDHLAQPPLDQVDRDGSRWLAFGIPAAAAIYHPLRKGDPHWLHRPGVAPGLAPCGRGDGMPPPRYLEVMQVAQDAIRATAAGIRAGQSQPTPGPTCEYCGFVDACRPEDAR